MNKLKDHVDEKTKLQPWVIYNAYKAELAGIVASLNHFYLYLKSSTTTVFTIHMPFVKRHRGTYLTKMYSPYLLLKICE